MRNNEGSSTNLTFHRLLKFDSCKTAQKIIQDWVQKGEQALTINSLGQIIHCHLFIERYYEIQQVTLSRNKELLWQV